jgi:uncharacterized protein (TIGR02246 family)
MRAVIVGMLASWEQADADALASSFTEDGELVAPGRVLKGRDALFAAATRFATRHSDVTVIIHRFVFGSESAAVEYRWEDIRNETGERNIADDVAWVDFRDGLIARWREYWDHETPRSRSGPPAANP